MRTIDAVVGVFQGSGNAWLNYNEIYEQMDKSVFGQNKFGERGKRNIVYRILLGYQDMFEVDESARPKKFRLATLTADNSQTEVELTKKYSMGEATVFFNGEAFHEAVFGLERDFEEAVKENHALIFGEQSYYYDVRKRIGKRICDAFVFDKEVGKLIVVENEIATHDLWGHIIPQIIEFFNGMRDDQTKQALKYDVEWNADDKLSIIEAIDKEQYEIVVVIDALTFDAKKARKDINELIKHFVRNKSISIHFREFKMFSSDKDQRRLFVVN
ncbi:hypothetical protein [Alicyclobacillus mengziensis]|uniref:Uncharacterized protein n=1 Tax=Alicyclobacillus mengziensis TaxID=2931921 RepID=A0A9X7Z838_9BACL|nr:hypothetical protein [Alicyclobacillus mengziensis]QSO49187.1 hypothetical protein JZ786_09840 [Alicyclobacillus mengziensis]